MKKSITKLAVLAFMSLYFAASAQNTDMVKKKGPDDTYARSSISYLLLDFSNEKFSSLLKQAINTTTMPSKFDNNDIRKKVIPSPYYRTEDIALNSKNSESVRSALIADRYAYDIVRYWWKIKDDGSYSTSLLQERGEYNATDIDYNQAMASKVGRAKIGDMGLKLIANSYVLVLDYHNIKTQDEIYDEQDRKAREKAEKEKTEFKPVKRIKNGFIGKLTAYLLQINYPDTVQAYLNESFIDEKKIDMNKFNKIFENVSSPIKLITFEDQPAEGTQPNPGEFMAPAVQKTEEELMVVLVNSGITKALNRIETRIEAFRVKTPVTNIGPIRAKIGKKESLTYERRYFVWEYVSDASTNVVARKRGVIRAKKVVDNRQDELGSTQESSFYQVAGKKITEGMTLQEAKDMGIGFGIGGGTDGLLLHLDINMGQFANLPLRQWKLYGDVAFAKPTLTPIADPTTVSGLYTFPGIDDEADFSSVKFSVGVQKDYPFMRNFHFGWYAGWGAETLTWDNASDRSESLLASGMQFGGRFGVNLLSSSIQLIGSLNYHGYGTVTYKYTPEDGEEQSEVTDYKWDGIFEAKSPVSFDLSVRFNF